MIGKYTAGVTMTEIAMSLIIVAMVIAAVTAGFANAGNHNRVSQLNKQLANIIYNWRY